MFLEIDEGTVVTTLDAYAAMAPKERRVVEAEPVSIVLEDEFSNVGTRMVRLFIFVGIVAPALVFTHQYWEALAIILFVVWFVRKARSH